MHYGKNSWERTLLEKKTIGKLFSENQISPNSFNNHIFELKRWLNLEKQGIEKMKAHSHKIWASALETLRKTQKDFLFIRRLQGPSSLDKITHSQPCFLSFSDDEFASESKNDLICKDETFSQFEVSEAKEAPVQNELSKAFNESIAGKQESFKLGDLLSQVKKSPPSITREAADLSPEIKYPKDDSDLEPVQPRMTNGEKAEKITEELLSNFCLEIVQS